MSRTRSSGLALAFLVLFLSASFPGVAQSYDFANGKAAVEVVIPAVAPVIFRDVSSSGGDATLVLRVTTLVTNSWFDAVAPYHASAVGSTPGWADGRRKNRRPTRS